MKEVKKIQNKMQNRLTTITRRLEQMALKQTQTQSLVNTIKNIQIMRITMNTVCRLPLETYFLFNNHHNNIGISFIKTISIFFAFSSDTR